MTIDIGTYSIKFCEFKKERKSVTLLSKYEVILDKVRQNYPLDATDFEIGIEIIQKYLTEQQFDGKIIYHLPQKFITSRQLELPLANRKKAEMMIPFMLDENLPLPIADLHYASYIHKKDEKHYALVNVIQKEFFSPFYQVMQEKHIMPAVLTSEQFVIQSYILEQGLNGKFCILDIGHETTKAYFVQNRQITSCHICYTGGRVINEIIASTYNIPLDEAIVYKHENCFLLTDDEYSEVDDDQEDFAKLMDKALSPLIQDLKKWELGFRVKQGSSIQKILLCGGSSNISNIENYIAKKMVTACTFLDKFEIQGPIEDDNRSYALSNMMAIGQKSKTPPTNLLTGHFTSGYTRSVSLHSSTFIFSRVLILSLFLIIMFTIERSFIIAPQVEKINKNISKLVKQQELQLAPKDQKKYKNRPDRLLSILKKKNRVVEQKIRTITSATSKNAISPLVTMSQFLKKNEAIDLSSFESRDGQVHASFSAVNKNDLKKLMEHFKTSPFKNIKFDLQEKLLTINFEE